MTIHPYLFFDGRCEEAIAFYRDALGARVDALMRFRDSPDPVPPEVLPPGNEDRVMHASLSVGDASFMMSDGGCSGASRFEGVSLALSSPEVATARRHFDALATGGTVTMPFGPTFWSPGFGAVVDRFGVSWMLMAEAPQPEGAR